MATYEDLSEPKIDQAAGTDGDKPLGPYQQDDEKLIDIIMRWYRDASKFKAPILKKRKTDHQMYAGKQYAQPDVDAAKLIKRVQLTINMILSIICAVEGEERTDRQEMKFYGNGEDDDNAANALNLILKWIMQGCGGEFALSEEFRDGIIAGEGWVVPEVDYFDDPEGLIKLVFVADTEIFDDPLCKTPTSTDSRFIIRVKQMTEDELEARWPGKAAELQAACGLEGFGVESDGKGYRDIYLEPNNTESTKLYDCSTKMWSVMETWWHQIEPGWVVVNEQTGLLEEKTPEEFEALKGQREQEIAGARMQVMQMVAGARQGMAPPSMPAMPGMPQPMMAPPMLPPIPQPLQAKQRPVRRFYQAFTSYKVLLEKQPSPLPRLKRFPYVPFRALFDRDAGEWFGIVRSITDVQKQHNVEQSVIVQLMQHMPKASWMGPKGSFHNKQEWQSKAGQTGQMLEYNGQRGKPEQIVTPPMPRHLVDMASVRPQTMRDISGVNVEMTGQRQGSDAGVVMEMRKKAAKTGLAPIFDNFRHTKIELGKVLLAYIQTYVSIGRRIRVVGPEGAKAAMMTTDMSIGRYDITVEETNSTVNDRIATLNILQTTLPQMMKAGISIPPDFIDLMPMPPHVRDAWKRQMAWQMTLNNQLPPPGWEPGMSIPMPGMPGMPPGAPPGAPPAPAQPPQQ